MLVFKKLLKFQQETENGRKIRYSGKTLSCYSKIGP